MPVSISGIVLLLVALLIGLELPDWDHRLPFLIHRSLITHGFLLPLALFVLVQRKTAPLRLFSMGFNVATAIHLCFDLFPRAWVGFALIHIPFWGRSNTLFSWVWISLSIVISLYLTFVLIQTFIDLCLIIGSLGLFFFFYAASQPAFGLALTALVAAIGITLLFPGNSQDILRTLGVRKIQRI